MAYTPPPIIQKPTPNKTLGRTEPIRAFVNHRMVGTLPGTDATFANKDKNVATHFAIGFNSRGSLEIHQYVAIDDTAWGNGTAEAGSNWQKWGMKNSELNAQTISIEHQDMDGSSANRGKVHPDVQQASQWLQALLLRGHEGELKKYGVRVRDWTTNWPVLRKELKAIPRTGKRIITHNDLSPAAKPYCWKPWAKDTVGFPRSTYVSQINLLHGYTDAIVPDPVTPPVPPTTYTQAQLDAAVAAAKAEQKAADQAAIDAANSAAAKSAAEAKAAPGLERERIAIALEASIADIVRNI